MGYIPNLDGAGDSVNVATLLARVGFTHIPVPSTTTRASSVATFTEDGARHSPLWRPFLEVIY